MPATATLTLCAAVDAANEALFYQRRLPADERAALIAAIAARHDGPDAYFHTFALDADERAAGIHLFTGERKTSAAARHIIGEEACRVLRLLKPADAAARTALRGAAQALAARMAPVGPSGPRPDDGQLHRFWPYRAGTFCCGACTVAFWRHILAGGFDHQEERLALGLKCLRTYRKADGTWRTFPYWYTVLALAEIDQPGARDELRYAAARLENAVRQSAGAAPYAQRRSELARRALARL